MARLIGSSPKIDDAMRERWWFLYTESRLIPRIIAERFGVYVGTVSAYLRERRKQEGVAKPVRLDTVTIKNSSKII